MKKHIYLFVLIGLSRLGVHAQSTEPVEVLVIGSIHFNQFHNQSIEGQNFGSPQRQAEFNSLCAQLLEFKPQAVFVEREISKQESLDSLYLLPKQALVQRGDYYSEVYQIGFRLAKLAGLRRVYGIDYYESIKQDLFEKADNLNFWKDSLAAFQLKARSFTKHFLTNEQSVSKFLNVLNQRENILMTQRLFLNSPAYLRNGSFKEEVTKAEIDRAYIGAEYISLFYERNLKIYSNILAQVERSNAERVIIIIGQVHAGVLIDLLRLNPQFMVMDALPYLK